MTNKTQPKKFSQRWKGTQRRIGITGGIASGKSTIGNYLNTQKQWPILDADLYAKEALKPGSVYTEEVFNRYGQKVIDYENNHQKEINRRFLSNIIFNDKVERVWLEKLIHPVVKGKIIKEIKSLESSPVLIIIIPLLFEVGLHNICSEVWVIDCSFEQQIERVTARDKITISEARQRIESQWPLDEKKDFGDYIINNSGSIDSWKKQVNQII